jgi:hypothetical protein
MRSNAPLKTPSGVYNSSGGRPMRCNIGSGNLDLGVMEISPLEGTEMRTKAIAVQSTIRDNRKPG